jgi:hypothetical protein
MKSDTFLSIRSYPNYRTEHQVYTALSDFYLYGIIDRLIFTDNTAVIIDYKTDNIQPDEIDRRKKIYLTQLKFYSYIVSRLFPEIADFEMRLIFLKHYNFQVIEKAHRSSMSQIESEIISIVEEIRTKRFPKNLKHCRECGYSIKGRCIQN